MSQPLSEEKSLDILGKITKLNAKQQALMETRDHIDSQLKMIYGDMARLQDMLSPEAAELHYKLL